MANNHAFGLLLRERRKALDLTQAALAACAGCATQTIRHIEAGRLRPSRQVAERLAECLAIPATERAAFVGSARTVAPPHDAKHEAAPKAAGAAHPSASNHPPEGRSLPLVGRKQELALLLGAMQSAAEHGPRLIALCGEPGIGKTRLGEELLFCAAAGGALTARAHCYAVEQHLAFGPVTTWLQTPAVQACIAGLAPVYRTELARLLPALLGEQTALPAPSPLTEAWQQQRFFQALAHAIVCQRQHHVLLLDDLQWCDEQTLVWLHYLLRYDRQAPLLLVATLRPDGVGQDHPVSAFLASVQRGGQLLELALEPLAAKETAALAELVAGRPLAAGHAARLYQQTEGYPLFVVESLRMGLPEHTPLRHAAEPGVRSDGELPMAPLVQAVLYARLAQLSAPARELAATAATIGRAFSLAVLKLASKLDEATLVQAIDELVQRRIVREHAAMMYDFSHDKLREVAYAEVSAAGRSMLHRRVAQALETVHAVELGADTTPNGAHKPGVDPGRLYLLLAHHHRAAGASAQAAVYLAKAGEHARHSFANQEAVRLLSEALMLDAHGAARAQPPQRAHWEWQLAEAYYALGNLPEASRHAREAVALWGYAMPKTRAGLAFGLLRELLRQLGHRLVPQRLIRAPAVAREALISASGAYERLARSFYFANDLPACTYATLQGVNLGERAGPSPQLAQAYAEMCVTAGFGGFHQIARVYGRRAMVLADAASHAPAFTYVSAYLTGIGEWATARLALQRASDLCGRLGDRRGWEESTGLLARVLHYQGQLAESEQLAGEVATSAAGRRDDHSEGYALTTCSMNLVCWGRFADAIPLLHSARAKLAGDPVQQMVATGLLAQAQLRLGDAQAASATARTAMDMVAHSRPFAVLALPGYAGVADVQLTLWEAAQRPQSANGRWPAAGDAALHGLTRYARIFPIGRPRAWLYRGLRECLCGSPKAALGAWHKSLDTAEALQMPYDRALAHHVLARHGNGAERSLHLARARSLFAGLGVRDDAVHLEAASLSLGP